ncbi:MAG: hypothetical protein EBS01_12115, partial [Verrucomicrobia bacterium]|nr:hypothetical protein [Verrucomicrobiota bacterium]
MVTGGSGATSTITFGAMLSNTAISNATGAITPGSVSISLSAGALSAGTTSIAVADIAGLSVGMRVGALGAPSALDGIITKVSAGTTTFTSGAAAISGTNQIVVSGNYNFAPGMILTGGGAGVIPANTTILSISSGTLTLSNALNLALANGTSLSAIGGTVTVSSGAFLPSVTVSASSLALSGANRIYVSGTSGLQVGMFLTGGGVGSIPSGTKILSISGNAVTLSAPLGAVLNSGTSLAGAFISGGTLSLAVTAPSVVPTFANSYSGPTVVNQGQLTIGGAQSAVGATLVNGDIVLNNANLVQGSINGSFAPTSNLTINGGGQLTLFGNNVLKAISFNDDGGTVTPTVTIPSGNLLVLAGNSITSSNDNFATTPTVAGTLELAGGNLTITTSGLSPNSLLLSGTIQNTMGGTLSPAGLIKNGPGSVILTGNNTFNGGVTLNAGVIVVGASTATALGALSTTGSLSIATTGTLSTLAATGTWAPGMWLYIAGGTSMGTAITAISGTTVTTAGSLAASGSLIYSAGAPITLNGGTLMSVSGGTQVMQPVIVAGSSVALGGPLAVNNINLGGPVYLGVGSLAYSGTQFISVASPLATGTISGALI